MVPGGGGRVRGAARGAEDLGRLAQCNNAFLRTKLNACPIGSLLSPVGNASVTARSAAFRVHQPLSPPAPSAPSRSLSSASSRIAPPFRPPAPQNSLEIFHLGHVSNRPGGEGGLLRDAWVPWFNGLVFYYKWAVLVSHSGPFLTVG